jgi:hypothetical protein
MFSIWNRSFLSFRLSRSGTEDSLEFLVKDSKEATSKGILRSSGCVLALSGNYL